ncbi:MAG: DUF4231 domain-containing protein [Sulfuricellaceae bacterium]
MEYINDRLQKQTQWYEESATKNKAKFISYQSWIIILGAVIPVLISFETIFSSMKEWVGPVSAIISACISILAGLDKLHQPQPNWFNYRANEEMLKKEAWYYKYRAGPYKNLKGDDAEASRLLVERTESIISADIARTLNLDKSKNNGQELAGDTTTTDAKSDKAGSKNATGTATQ